MQRLSSKKIAEVFRRSINKVIEDYAGHSRGTDETQTSILRAHSRNALVKQYEEFFTFWAMASFNNFVNISPKKGLNYLAAVSHNQLPVAAALQCRMLKAEGNNDLPFSARVGSILQI